MGTDSSWIDDPIGPEDCTIRTRQGTVAEPDSWLVLTHDHLREPDDFVIGTIINPLIVAGQVHGGLVQGIAQALWEEAVHDEAGTLVSGSFVDYLLPTSADTISFDVVHVDDPSVCTTNSLGTKGVGEAGTIASTPAVVNAVVDAVRHLGVTDVQMPCTPERVWRAIEDSRAGGATETPPDAMPHFQEGALNQDSTDGAGQ